MVKAIKKVGAFTEDISFQFNVLFYESGITVDNPPGAISVLTSQLITYAQKTGYTRLRLTGRKVLEVRETTEEIDRLVRGATSSSVR